MAKLELIYEKTEWKRLLDKYSVTDVYYQYEYAKPMADHIKAKSVLLNYESKHGGFVYVLLIRDIAEDFRFKNLIPKGCFFDSETPYGYGGPFFYGDFEIEEQDICKSIIMDKLKELGIVSQFIRFNPIFFDDKRSTIIVDKYGSYKNTVYMNLESEEIIISNLDSQYRRKIKKAKEAGVIIRSDRGENIDAFIKLYNMTMKKHQADDMYYFEREYYESLIRGMHDNIEIFYAWYDNKIVGASIFLYDNENMHFHLGGRDVEGPNLPFENLIMVEAAKCGMAKGMKRLHIGGGISEGDSLYQYKIKFNRSGTLPFYIGRSIIDSDKYEYLMKIREQSDSNFNVDNKFYIQYRF